MERYDKKYTLSKDNTITLMTDGQLRGVIQHFKVSCPNGGLIKQKSITIDLLPPVEFRGEKLCPDSVSFVFNNDNSHTCRFCGNKFTLDSNSCTLAKFRELLVTFRSGYRPTSPDYSGFKATVSCYDAAQEQDECLMYDPNLTSEKYLDNLKIRDSSQAQDGFEADLNLLSKVSYECRNGITTVWFQSFCFFNRKHLWMQKNFFCNSIVMTEGLQCQVKTIDVLYM